MSHNFLIFDTSPESFCENVINGSSLSVHTDQDIAGKKTLQVAVTGEMATLVAVENRGESGRKGPIHTIQDKRHLEGLIEYPGDDITRVPVDNGHQVHPPVRHADVSDVDPPYVVWILGSNVPEQVGIGLVLQSPFAEIGAWVDALNPHLAHRGPNPVAPHDTPFSPKDGLNPATSEERPTGIDLVDPVPERNLFGRRQDRLVIEPGTGESQKRGLCRERKLQTVAFDQVFAVTMA